MKSLTRLLRIEREEIPWVMSFSGAIFFLVAAMVISGNLVISLVVKRAGVGFLPYFFVIGALSLLVGYAVAGHMLKRLSQAATGLCFLLFSVVGSIIIAATQGGMSHDTPMWQFGLFILLAAFVNGATVDIASDTLKVMATSLFNIDQMGRLYPLLATAATASTFLSSLLLAFIGEQWSISSLFWLIPGLLCVSGAFYLSVRLQLANEVQMIDEDGTAPTSLWSDWRVGQFAKDKQLGNFVRLLSLIIGMSIVFSRLFQYMFTVAADAHFATEADMNSFSGAYGAVYSLVLVVYVNVVQRRIFRRYGSGRSISIPPLLVALGVGLVMLFPAFSVVVGVVFMRDIIISIQGASYRAMLEGISDFQRSRVWAWLDGPVTAIGDLLGSSMVGVATLVLAGMSVPFIIRAIAGIALAMLMIRFALDMRLRMSFPVILLNSVKKGDFKTRLRAMEAMIEFRFLKDRHLGAVLDVLRNESDPVALRIEAIKTVAGIHDPSSLRLMSRFFEHPDPALRVAAIRAVTAFDFEKTQAYETGFSRHVLINKLKDVFSRETRPEAVNAILDALISLRDPDIIPFLIKALVEGSPHVRHSCLRSLRHFHDPAIIDYVRPFLHNPDPDLRAQAVAATWQFPWEHEALTLQALEELIGASPESEAYRQGLFLIGALQLTERKPEALKALRSELFPMRLAAAIALLKLDDLSGIPTLEEALSEGTRQDAYEVERLVNHSNVPELERKRVAALVHAYHLHYPAQLPVSEPLRVRLVDIPKKCLEALLPLYAGAGDVEDRRKIEKALLRSTFPSIQGRAVLIGLDDTWNGMMSIALLANGILVRRAKPGEELREGEVVLGMAGTPGLPPTAFVLSDKIEGLSVQEIVKSHYAPSEAVRAMFPSLHL